MNSGFSKTHKYYVGIDIGYMFHEASCIESDRFTDNKQSWKKSKTIKFNSDSKGISLLLSSLYNLSKNPEDFCILMEPTGIYYSIGLISSLEKAGYKVYQADSKAVKDVREKNLGIGGKSDSIDCRVIAYLGFLKALTPSMNWIRIARSTSESQMAFRALASDRWSLKKQVSRCKSQLEQVMAATHPELKSVCYSVVKPSIRRLLMIYPTSLEMALASQEKLYQDLIMSGAVPHAKNRSVKLKEMLNNTVGVSYPYLVVRQKCLIEEINRLEENISRIDNQVQVMVDEHPYKQVLWSLPAKGYIWACVLIGVIGDIQRFSNSRQFKRYLGFSPDNKESGISIRGKRLSHCGVRDSRKVLFQMTLSLIMPARTENPFKGYYRNLVSRNMPKMKALGHVAGKLAQVMYGCLKYNRMYDPTIHARAMRIGNS